MPSDEIIDIVNNEDVVIGQMPLGTARDQGKVYRLVAVLVFNSKGKLFLQKRSMQKRFPGHFSSSAGGHVQTGEEYLEAAKRELAEELGINDAELEFLKKEKVTYENKDRFVAIFKTTYDGEMKLDKHEVHSGMFVDIPKVKVMLENGEKFTPVFHLLIKGVLENATSYRL